MYGSGSRRKASFAGMRACFFVAILFVQIGHSCSAMAQSSGAERQIVDALNPPHWQLATDAAKGISDATLPLALIMPGLIAWHQYKHGDSSWGPKLGEALAANVLANGLAYSLKLALQRKRPYRAYPGQIALYGPKERTNSFPSGHSTAAFAMAASASIQSGHKLAIVLPAYAIATGVGLSRMHLGVHYPSDVLAGAAIGIGSAYATHYLTRWLQGR